LRRKNRLRSTVRRRRTTELWDALRMLSPMGFVTAGRWG